ncbi:MAG: hypothetical protein US48_C0043G0005 [Candidatus Levybacteria bacterium GW2011_GWA2_37_36]|nr:MAG: hypothetical protein US48_C0043G0005 [Candidatus Levybacteria bacterium GW2011_GWA2_37_36]
MDNSKLLNQIGSLIKKELVPIKKQLDTVEIKVEVVNKRVGQAEKNLERKIMQSQEETIDALSELINTGYDLHEKRIAKIEDNLGITTPHQ